MLRLICLVTATLIMAPTAFSQGFAGAKIVTFHGYDDCIELSNARTRVVLCPAAGGRVLEYSLDGKNMLYLPDEGQGYHYDPNSNQRGAAMNAGRFDIGPEKLVNRGRVLWQGRWDGELTGDRKARLTSQYDPQSGVRLVRDFQLDHTSSRLRCTQTIINESKKPVSLCYWSRTFAIGGGVAVVPRSPIRRFPDGYVLYENGNEITINAEDPAIQVTDDTVVVTRPPRKPKLGFDSHSGWLAYLAPNDHMFVKRFKTYPERAYNEFAGLTISIWYPKSNMIELEPIGPAENLAPGKQASFGEEWWLVPYEFPADVENVDIDNVRKTVRGNTVPAMREAEPPASPEVHPDRSVTFRFVGEDADEVKVQLLGKEQSLRQDEDGLWSLTTKPLEPGIYDYVFVVDGIRVTDPRNRWVKKWKVCASMLEIPAETPLLTERQTVPHGTLHHQIYASKTTGTERDVVVYTPPGYPAGDDELPLLVLCHGNGDDQTAWTEVGRAQNILDNLIAQNAIPPMVVAMPHGHPIPLKNHHWSDDYGDQNERAMVDDIANDLLPFIEANYRVSSDPDKRAITGLSMGGGQSIVAGMLHPDKFHWVGAFSAAAPREDLTTTGKWLVGGLERHQQRKVFWIACGEKDFLLDRNQTFSKRLKALGIEHEYVETAGGHTWEVWRDYLPEFLGMIFK